MNYLTLPNLRNYAYQVYILNVSFLTPCLPYILFGYYEAKLCELTWMIWTPPDRQL